MRWVSRSASASVSGTSRVAESVGRARARADVVYATSMIGRTALGASSAREPFVIKLTTDAAFERAQRPGLFDGDLDAFQREARGGSASRAAAARDVARPPRRARRLPERVPARARASSWGVPPDRVLVLPNPAPTVPAADARRSCERGSASTGRRSPSPAGSAARSRSEVALDARRRRSTGVSLVVAGDGAERAAARASAPRSARRARALPRRRCRATQVLELFRAATRACSPRRGRTSRTRWSSRSPSARR